MGARDLKKEKRKRNALARRSVQQKCDLRELRTKKKEKKKKKKRHGVEISRWIDIRRRRNDKGYHRDFASENTSPKTKLAKATAAARTVFFSTRQFLTSQKSL